MRLWGKVGEFCFFYIIMFLIIELNKLCFCYDECYLDFWIKDLLFILDIFIDVYRFVEENVYMVCCDEKFGYDYIKFIKELEIYFGI